MLRMVDHRRGDISGDISDDIGGDVGGGRPARPGEAGSASLELVIVAPGLLLILAMLLQAGWWYMARSTAHAAAAEGVRAARTRTGTLADGDTAALTFARDVGKGQLLNPAVDHGGSSATVIAITVSGKAPTFLPGFDLTVSQTARAPKERFTIPGQP